MFHKSGFINLVKYYNCGIDMFQKSGFCELYYNCSIDMFQKSGFINLVKYIIIAAWICFRNQVLLFYFDSNIDMNNQY